MKMPTIAPMRLPRSPGVASVAAVGVKARLDADGSLPPNSDGPPAPGAEKLAKLRGVEEPPPAEGPDDPEDPEVPEGVEKIVGAANRETDPVPVDPPPVAPPPVTGAEAGTAAAAPPTAPDPSLADEPPETTVATALNRVFGVAINATFGDATDIWGTGLAAGSGLFTVTTVVPPATRTPAATAAVIIVFF
jgi:hypothetical protein